jgi:iron-sulfur cluster repair protein YtfE (RIC family)
MAQAKAKTRTRAKTNAKTRAKKTTTRPKARSAARRKVAGLDLSRIMEDVRIGGYGLDDVLEGSSKNMEAIAQANRAIIDGYTDIARRQYEMLKDLLDQLRKVSGDRDAVVKDLKRVVEHARKDLHALQKMASKTNSQVQRIVKRRTDANIKAWKKLIAEAREAVGGGDAVDKVAGAVKEASDSTKAAAKKTVATARKAATKKVASGRKKAAVKKKAPAKKKAAARKAAAKKAPAKKRAAPRKKAPASKSAA